MNLYSRTAAELVAQEITIATGVPHCALFETMADLGRGYECAYVVEEDLEAQGIAEIEFVGYRESPKYIGIRTDDGRDHWFSRAVVYGVEVVQGGYLMFVKHTVAVRHGLA